MDLSPRTSRRRFLLSAWIATAPGCAWAPARSGSGLPPRSVQPPDGPSEPIAPEELEELRSRIVEAHDKIRANVRLGKLVPSRKLTLAAQAHAEDMAARRKMSHTGKDGSTTADRVKAQGYRFRRIGENVAYGRFSVDRVMRGWMDSSPHKHNILGGFTEIGVGCAVGEDGNRYWCVNFGLPPTR